MAELEEPKGTLSPQETVPLRDLLAIKSAKERAERELTEAQQSLTEAQQRVAELESGGEVNQAEARKQLYIAQQTLAKERRALTQRETTVVEQERKLHASQLAQQYGVKAEDLLKFNTPAEMQIAALEAQNTALRNAQPQPKPAAGKFEAGAATAAAQAVAGMDVNTPEGRKAFSEHVARLKTEALKRQ